MAEYIEREAAIASVCCDCSATADCRPGERCADYRRIKELPTADVAPVRHGRWIKAKGSWVTPGGDPVWECSECGKGRHVYGIEHGTYGSDVAAHQWVACPNCGAKMDKELC